jgi:predicted DCC family thiol-disulfide oxidoreductase YuxK
VPLPSPAERPDAPVLIYDGHCKFCTAQVQKLARWDGKGRIAFLSLHDPEVPRRWPDLTHEMLMEQMYLVDPAGNRYGGASAFRYLTRQLPRLWILAPLLHIPFALPLWQFLYRQIARRRYLLGKTTDQCDDGACRVHFK